MGNTDDGEGNNNWHGRAHSHAKHRQCGLLIMGRFKTVWWCPASFPRSLPTPTAARLLGGGVLWGRVGHAYTTGIGSLRRSGHSSPLPTHSSTGRRAH